MDKYTLLAMTRTDEQRALVALLIRFERAGRWLRHSHAREQGIANPVKRMTELSRIIPIAKRTVSGKDRHGNKTYFSEFTIQR